MGVDDPERLVLAAQVKQRADQDRVFEDIGEIAGVEVVAVVHGPAGATTLWLRQLSRATCGQATKFRKSFDRQNRASRNRPRRQVTAIMPARRRGLASMKARWISRGASLWSAWAP